MFNDRQQRHIQSLCLGCCCGCVCAPQSSDACPSLPVLKKALDACPRLSIRVSPAVLAKGDTCPRDLQVCCTPDPADGCWSLIWFCPCPTAPSAPLSPLQPPTAPHSPPHRQRSNAVCELQTRPFHRTATKAACDATRHEPSPLTLESYACHPPPPTPQRPTGTSQAVRGHGPSVYYCCSSSCVSRYVCDKLHDRQSPSGAHEDNFAGEAEKHTSERLWDTCVVAIVSFPFDVIAAKGRGALQRHSARRPRPPPPLLCKR